MVPVEIERNERVYIQNPDGSYEQYMQTSPTAPTHEAGGVKTELPEGSLVFPKQYFSDLDQAFTYGGKTGDWSKMDKVAARMRVNANKAFMEGQPYSSGGQMRPGGDTGEPPFGGGKTEGSHFGGGANENGARLRVPPLFRFALGIVSLTI